MRAVKIPLTCREARKRLGTRVAILSGGAIHEGRLASYTPDPETDGVLCATLEIGGEQRVIFIQGRGGVGHEAHSHFVTIPKDIEHNVRENGGEGRGGRAPTRRDAPPPTNFAAGDARKKP